MANTTSIQILSDEMYELLMSVKNAQKNQPNLTMEKFTGTDGDEPSSYSDAQINAIMDFWKNPVDNYIKVSDLTGTGQKLDEISMSFKDQLTQSETRNNEAIKALSDRVEDELKKNGETLAQSLKEHQEKAFSAFEEKQNKSIENLQAKHEQALKDSEERQQKQFADFSSKLFADLDAKLSSFSSAVALQLDEIKSSQKTAKPKAEKVNESAAESKPETNETVSKASEPGEQTGEPENDTAEAVKSDANEKANSENTEGGEVQTAEPDVAPEVRSEDDGGSVNKAEAVSEAKAEGADAQSVAESGTSENGKSSKMIHEIVEAYSADFAQVIAELRNVNHSLVQLREDFGTLKTDLDELKKEVSEISCISPVPLESHEFEKSDGSDDVINKIVRETAMSSLLTSPLAILDATLRKYRDSFAQRYAAAMGCLMAQDGEVNLQFGRNAQQSLDLVTKNSGDYQRAVMALTQSPAPKTPQAETKPEHLQSQNVKKPVKPASHTAVKRNEVKRTAESGRVEQPPKETLPKPSDQAFLHMINDYDGGDLK
ncbi:MAG: hypothetical protein PUA61_03910 [Succinatimonas hippei]|nr:hypothetical protein [Succinatimonas hippei]